MKKIVSLFVRNYEGNRQVIDEVVEGAEWVQAGEGVATRKYDGTCALVRDGHLFKRYELRDGKPEPFGFEPAGEKDPKTGKTQGWVEVGNGNEDKWFREAVGGNPDKVDLPDGTYELVGAKVQGNPENYDKHTLVAHADAEQFPDAPRTYNEIKEWFKDKDIEGLVWHNPDGRMVKIKKKDFGLKRRS